jgi:hypothetical protein
MKKVSITTVDLYDVIICLRNGTDEPIKLEFQTKEIQFYPSSDVMTWMAVTGEVFSINAAHLLWARQTPIKTHVEEVEVP